MVIAKIVLAGVAIVVLMAVAQDRRWPQKAGVVGVCGPSAAPASAPSGYWYACKEGLFTGFPNVETDRCTRFGIVHRREIWQCDTPLESLPGA